MTVIFRNHFLLFLHIMQHLLKTRALKMEPRETIIHIVIKDAEPILLTELAQHHLLCFYAYAFTDLLIVFAQATIDGCFCYDIRSPPSWKAFNKE